MQLKLSLGQSSKCVGRILFFTSFFLNSSVFPLPLAQCRLQTVTLFLRIQVRRASSPKKIQSQDKRGGQDWGEKLKLPLIPLTDFKKKQTRLVCSLCCTNVLQTSVCAPNCFVISKNFQTSFVRNYCRLQSENVKAHKPH